MKFRPCIDLRGGKVVQMVGGTLSDHDITGEVTNFESDRRPGWFASLYKEDNLVGGHVIALGQGNDAAALEALAEWPGGMQMGGGINPQNAAMWLDAGASHVIVTSYIFAAGELHWNRLEEMKTAVGPERLVIDLSCRFRHGAWWVVTDRWQTFTRVQVEAGLLQTLSKHCAEFLVHGVDVEGLKLGVEDRLVELLGLHSPIPVTYAGGVRSLHDMDCVAMLGKGRVDATVGSALDIFGGDLPYADVVAWHHRQNSGT